MSSTLQEQNNTAADHMGSYTRSLLQDDNTGSRRPSRQGHRCHFMFARGSRGNTPTPREYTTTQTVTRFPRAHLRCIVLMIWSQYSPRCLLVCAIRGPAEFVIPHAVCKRLAASLPFPWQAADGASHIVRGISSTYCIIASLV